MNKFWKWMKKNKYGIKGKLGNIINQNGHQVVNPPTQMLIGYMMEYLIYKGDSGIEGLCQELENKIKED